MSAETEQTERFPLLLSKEQVQDRVRAVARQLEKDFAGQQLVIVMVLKGAICIVNDLMQELQLPFTLECIRCESYGQRGCQGGELTISGVDRLQIKAKHVLVVDDICDTGQTLELLSQRLQTLEPRSLSSLVMLLRNREEGRQHAPDYALFDLPERDFVIGYGLDYKEAYRGLPGVYLYRDLPSE